MRVRLVNEAKLTYRNAFINNASVLEHVKQSENDKGILFWEFPWCLDLFQTTLIATFADYFSFRQFSATSCSFWEKKTKIVIFCTIFQEKQVNFLQSRLTTLQKNDKETFFLDFSGSLGLAHNS